MNTKEREPTLANLRIRDLSAEVQIECKPKADGSFTLRLESEGGENFAKIRSITKIDGLTFKVREIVEGVQNLLKGSTAS